MKMKMEMKMRGDFELTWKNKVEVATNFPDLFCLSMCVLVGFERRGSTLFTLIPYFAPKTANRPDDYGEEKKNADYAILCHF